MCFGTYGGYVRKGNTARPGQLAPIRPAPAQVLLQPLLTLRWTAFRYLLIHNPLNSHFAHLFSSNKYIYFIFEEWQAFYRKLSLQLTLYFMSGTSLKPGFDGSYSDADPRCKIVLPLHSTRRGRNDTLEAVEAINTANTNFSRRFQ